MIIIFNTLLFLPIKFHSRHLNFTCLTFTPITFTTHELLEQPSHAALVYLQLMSSSAATSQLLTLGRVAMRRMYRVHSLCCALIFGSHTTTTTTTTTSSSTYTAVQSNGATLPEYGLVYTLYTVTSEAIYRQAINLIECNVRPVCHDFITNLMEHD